MGHVNTIPVSLIIPIYNESNQISDLITAITKQTVLPYELIIIDAGSNDGTLEIVKNVWIRESSNSSGCKLITDIVIDAYPGGGRNHGIKLAGTEWVVFIDSGIYPEDDWLENLWNFQQNIDSDVIFGLCDFDSDNAVGKAVCGVAYGIGRKISTIPGSIIKKNIFQKVGFFREDLRAAEDLEWRSRYNKFYPTNFTCESSILHYREVPENFHDVFRKWFISAKYTVYSGVKEKQIYFYLLAGIIILAIGIIQPKSLYLASFIYLLFRGIIDPFRRSILKKWWGETPSALLLTPIAALVIDFAKFSSFAISITKKIIGIKLK